jgi:tetratricopeptide (TPR) repeat protein
MFKKKELEKSKVEQVILISPHIMAAPQYAQPVSSETMSGLSAHPYFNENQTGLLRYDEEKGKLKPIKDAKEKRRKERERMREEKAERERLEAERREKEKILKEKISGLKKEAKKLYYKKSYPESLDMFKEVLELDPQDKTSLKYIKLIHKKAKTGQRKSEENVENKPEKYENEPLKHKSEPEKKKELQKESSEKETRQKPEEPDSDSVGVDTKETSGKLNNEVMQLYDTATNLFMHRYYEKAKVKFEEIEKLCPNALRTRYYLAIIPERIKQAKERGY